MAKDQTRRLSPVIIQGDRDTLAVLAGITGYTPSNPDFALVRLQTASGTMTAEQANETQKFPPTS